MTYKIPRPNCIADGVFVHIYHRGEYIGMIDVNEEYTLLITKECDCPKEYEYDPGIGYINAK